MSGWTGAAPTRRAFLGALPAAGALLLVPALPSARAGAVAPEAALRDIEARTGGRLGVSILDPSGASRAAFRADERFPLCSTFKLLLAAAVLKRVDEGRESLDRRIVYQRADLVTYSPITEKHAGEGMTVAGLCEATVTLSDNTAANLLLATMGGPEGFTALLRTMGDDTSRLDRWETALNSALPGDVRDTTTPRAMARDIHAFLTGSVLSSASRTVFADWHIATKTGDARLRAGLPGWRVGDKTGTGDMGTFNDVGFGWPPGEAGAPFTLVVYLTGSRLDLAGSNAAIADVARLVGANGR